MTGATQMLTIRVPLAVRKRGGRKLVLTPGGMANRGASGADTTLAKALARAFRWRRMMETGRFATLNELAAAENITSSYVSRLLRLTLLAPEIVEAILVGRQPERMTLPKLMVGVEGEWGSQQAAIPPRHVGRSHSQMLADVRNATPVSSIWKSAVPSPSTSPSNIPPSKRN